jgi:cytochrome b subunit of formate dehydrogenase
MKHLTLNTLIDLGSLITFVPMLVTGLVLYLYLPSGTGRGGASWMEISRHDWVLYHDIASFAFVTLIIVHLLLHRAFFRTLIQGRKHQECENPDRAAE